MSDSFLMLSILFRYLMSDLVGLWAISFRYLMSDSVLLWANLLGSIILSYPIFFELLILFIIWWLCCNYNLMIYIWAYYDRLWMLDSLTGIIKFNNLTKDNSSSQSPLLISPSKYEIQAAYQVLRRVVTADQLVHQGPHHPQAADPGRHKH